VNDILKQRLVGALILLALGVVFWPIIFVEPGERAAVGQVAIPPAPRIDTTPIEPPDREGLRASPEEEPDEDAWPADLPMAAEQGMDDPVASQSDPDEATPPAQDAATDVTRTRSAPPEQPVLDSKGVPVAWVLQVASVSSEAKAEELRKRLLDMQEKAYVKKVVRGEKVLHRVYVGPIFERAKLEKIQAGVDARFGVHSLIVRYIP